MPRGALDADTLGVRFLRGVDTLYWGTMAGRRSRSPMRATPSSSSTQLCAARKTKGGRYWPLVRKRFPPGQEGDKAFKEVVIKDHETVASIGVLIMPIAFAGLATLPNETESSLFSSNLIQGWLNLHTAPLHNLGVYVLLLRWLYIFFVVLAIGLSSLGTLTAMRTQLMINANPEDRALPLLVVMTQKRGPFIGEYLYPFNAIKMAIVCLLMAMVLLVESKYGIEEGLFCFTIVLGVQKLWATEDTNHAKAQYELYPR